MPKRILIAEDDSMSLSILRLMLESAGGFAVSTAADGVEAWKLLDATADFDLCIFDIIMPGLDGLALTNRLRNDARFRELPVILCTAVNDRTTIDQAAGLEIGHYIVKPYIRDHVLKQVRRLCKERAPAANVEPPERTAQRLGLEPVQVVDFLQNLFKQTAELSAQLRAQPDSAAASGTTIRANALKGAAINLGAHSLAARLAALENRGTTRGSKPLPQILGELEAETAQAARVVGTAVTRS
jgi:CheY-like chemotaxis protein